MATPLLNKELLKLRRRLGDLWTVGTDEITESTIGSSDGKVWTAAELIDLYNDAIEDCLNFVITTVPKDAWYTWIPGFIYILSSQVITSGKLLLSTLDPIPYFIMSLWYATGVRQLSYINPDEYSQTKGNRYPNRHPSSTELYYTVINDASGSEILSIPASTYDVCDVIYIKQPIDYVADSATDLSGLNSTAKRKVIDFAEAEAIKQKQAVSPEYIQNLMALKAKANTGNVNTKAIS
jgi:hypothetical protein